MIWKELLDDAEIITHTTSRRELETWRELISRDLKDAGLDGLSADRKFATAYNAALQLSKMAIAGYRVTAGAGHHRNTFEAVKLALNFPAAEDLADYFDVCRRKRNVIDYDAADTITKTEADELLEKAKDFRKLVEEWIAQNHPAYSD